MFASILLASRLPTHMHVFGLMSMGVNWFALFPYFRNAIMNVGIFWLEMLLNFVLFSVTLMIMSHISPSLGMMYIFIIVSITFIGTEWFYYLQKYKKYYCFINL